MSHGVRLQFSHLIISENTLKHFSEEGHAKVASSESHLEVSELVDNWFVQEEADILQKKTLVFLSNFLGITMRIMRTHVQSVIF